MASLTPSDSWDDVYQLETTDPVQGGVGGISNTPHQNNTNRTERIKETLNLVGIDVENKLINKNRIEYVDSLSELQALTGMAEDDVVHISGRTTINDGGQGNFIWRVGDYSAQVTADTLSGIYAPSDADPTGVAGCWVRQLSGYVTPEMFGGATSAAMNAAAQMYPIIHLESGTYTLAEDVILPKNVIFGRGIDKTIVDCGAFKLSFGGASDDPYGSGIEKCTIIGSANTDTLVEATGTNAWKFYTRDLVLLGSGTCTRGIYIDDNAYEPYIENIRMTGFTTSAIDFGSLTGIANSWVMTGVDITPYDGAWGIRNWSENGFINDSHIEAAPGTAPNGHIQVNAGRVFVGESLLGATRNGGPAVTVMEGGFHADNVIFGSNILEIDSGCSIGSAGSYNVVSLSNCKCHTPLPNAISLNGGYRAEIDNCSFYPLVGSGYVAGDAIITGTLSNVAITNNEAYLNTETEVYLTDIAVATFSGNKTNRMLGCLNKVSLAIGNIITASTINAVAINADAANGNQVTCASGAGITAVRVAEGNYLGANTGISIAGTGRCAGNYYTSTSYFDKASGIATVLNGTTSITVSVSGFAYLLTSNTILSKFISVIPNGTLGAAAKFWVTRASDTAFTITLDANPGTDVAFLYKLQD